MSQPTPRDPHDGIDPAANREAQAAERDQTSYVARGGSSSGVVDTGPAPGDEQPSRAVAGGTSGCVPLAGVGLSPEDAVVAVLGDTGPERPGRQG